MDNFFTISSAQHTLIESKGETKNSSIIGKVIKIGELNAGTSKKGDWTNKAITLQDESGEQVLTAWNKDIEIFELNTTYEIVRPWWTLYEGKPQLQLGNFGKAIPKKPDETTPKGTGSITTTECNSTLDVEVPIEGFVPSKLTDNEMLSRIYGMVADMYRDFIDFKKEQSKQ